MLPFLTDRLLRDTSTNTSSNGLLEQLFSDVPLCGGGCRLVASHTWMDSRWDHELRNENKHLWLTNTTSWITRSWITINHKQNVVSSRPPGRSGIRLRALQILGLRILQVFCNAGVHPAVVGKLLNWNAQRKKCLKSHYHKTFSGTCRLHLRKKRCVIFWWCSRSEGDSS